MDKLVFPHEAAFNYDRQGIAKLEVTTKESDSTPGFLSIHLNLPAKPLVVNAPEGNGQVLLGDGTSAVRVAQLYASLN